MGWWRRLWRRVLLFVLAGVDGAPAGVPDGVPGGAPGAISPGKTANPQVLTPKVGRIFKKSRLLGVLTWGFRPTGVYAQRGWA